MRKSVRILSVLAVAAAVFGACGGDDGSNVRSASGSGSASGSTSGSGSGTASGTATDKCEVVDGVKGDATDDVHVELTEFKIALDKATVPAGKIKFEAENAGEEPHEIAIVRTENGAALKSAEDGSAEEGDGLIGEIEPFDGGKECDGTFELTAGTYQVICNIVEEEDGETEAHFKEGMHTLLTVS